MNENKRSDMATSIRIGNVEELGRIVRETRNRQGMTQADILGLANTGNRFIVELENGKSTVQLGKVLTVLDALGLELQVCRKVKR